MPSRPLRCFLVFDRQIQDLQDKKRVLYEQLLLQEISMEEYKSQKAAIDVELNRIKRLYAVLAAQTTQMRIDNEAKVTASTGYQQQIRIQNAFKFDIFLSVRNKCTEILKINGLVDGNDKWRKFSYKKCYKNDQAIVVFVYDTLIDCLNLKGTELSIGEKSKQFVKNYQEDEIFELMK